MCVRITKRLKKRSSKVRYAWKVLELHSGWWEPLAKPGYFRRGEWVRASHKWYGFNCFATETGADKFKFAYGYGEHSVVRVRIRGVEGYGKVKDGYKVIFAREIWVPKCEGKGSYD